MGIVPPVSLAALLTFVPAHVEDTGAAHSAHPGRTPRSTTVPELGDLESFLQMDPEERFEIEVINAIDFQTLVEQAVRNDGLCQRVVKLTKELMPRVQAETEEAALVGAFLRAKTVDWYRRSINPGWVATMPLRWGGIFYDSRVPGGRFSRKLSVRLANLYMECAKAGGWRGRLKSMALRPYRAMTNTTSFGDGSKRIRGSLVPPVAQAYLDDLAICGREGDKPVPLERLSDVARRNGSAEVNRTLGDLFPHHTSSSVTVLDHRFHPDMSTLMIRIVGAGGGSGESATYDLVQRKPSASHESDASESEPEASPESLWKRPGVTKDEWMATFAALKRRKARLDAPALEYRNGEAYLGLRHLLLEDEVARKAFQIVQWKGKPSGLILLCRLLGEETFTPEVETDGDYLEAELDLLDKGHAARQPNGPWKIDHGWIVAREIAPGNVRTYRAARKSLD